MGREAGRFSARACLSVLPHGIIQSQTPNPVILSGALRVKRSSAESKDPYVLFSLSKPKVFSQALREKHPSFALALFGDRV
jgi:hypothetical protein